MKAYRFFYYKEVIEFDIIALLTQGIEIELYDRRTKTEDKRA